ncbi:MAG: hypothetical protein ACT6SC_17120, partial [Blastomonas fulva]
KRRSQTVPLLCQNTLLLSMIFLSSQYGISLQDHSKIRLLQSATVFNLRDPAQWPIIAKAGKQT